MRALGKVSILIIAKKHIKVGVSFLIYRETEAFFTWIIVYIIGTGLPQGKLFPFLQLCLRLCCRRMRISWACFSFVLVGRLCLLYVGAWNRKCTPLISFALAILITLRSLVNQGAKGTPAPARPPTHHRSLWYHVEKCSLAPTLLLQSKMEGSTNTAVSLGPQGLPFDAVFDRFLPAQNAP